MARDDTTLGDTPLSKVAASREPLTKSKQTILQVVIPLLQLTRFLEVDH